MSIKSASMGAAALVAAAVFAGPALADGMPSRGKIADAPRTCAFSGNIAVTTDYVFRGISQSSEDAALQGGLEASCGKFYVGFFGSSVEFGDNETSVEMDLYAGFRTSTGAINWDIGVIYYGYPGGASNADFFEVKVGASGDIWKGGTLGGTVYYSPEYTADAGPVWTLEATFAQALPKVGMFTPTFSATVGTSLFSDDSDLDYVYWNAGLTLGFLEKWSLDLRYWDSDGEGFAGGPAATLSDERFVGTLKYSF